MTTLDHRMYWHRSVRPELLKFGEVPAATRRAFAFVLAELFIADTEGYDMMSPPAFAAPAGGGTYFAQRCGEVAVCALYLGGRVRMLHATLVGDEAAFDQAIAVGRRRIPEYASMLRDAV